MSRQRTSRKKRQRERRAADRHGLTILEYRANPPATGKRRRVRDPFEDHEQWRQEADE